MDDIDGPIRAVATASAPMFPVFHLYIRDAVSGGRRSLLEKVRKRCDGITYNSGYERSATAPKLNWDEVGIGTIWADGWLGGTLALRMRADEIVDCNRTEPLAPLPGARCLIRSIAAIVPYESATCNIVKIALETIRTQPLRLGPTAG